jgi:hypothetical protein
MMPRNIVIGIIFPRVTRLNQTLTPKTVNGGKTNINKGIRSKRRWLPKGIAINAKSIISVPK